MGNKISQRHSDIVTSTETPVPSFKIAVVGSPEAGKSSVCLRYVHNQFDEYYKPTKIPHIETVIKTVNIPGHCVVSLSLWDLPGREDLDLRQTYFRNLDAALVVVDISDESSVELAGAWKQDVQNQVTVTLRSNPDKPQVIRDDDHDEEVFRDSVNIPILLLGNKYDKIHKNVVQVQPTDQELLDSELKGERVKRPPHLETPDCVRLLEKVGEDHAFIASAAVSCKDNDGSLVTAVTCLVRHLIQSKHPHVCHAWQPSDSPEQQPDLHPVLVKVGRSEIDATLAACDELLRFCTKLSRCHRFSFVKLRELCHNYAFVNPVTASLDDCIRGLESGLPTGYTLKPTEEEGFCLLMLQMSNPNTKAPKELKKVLKCFNTEYAVMSKTILRHAARLKDTFDEFDAQLGRFCDDLEREADATNTPQLEAEKTKIKTTVEYNRGVLVKSHDELNESVTLVKNNAVKIFDMLCNS